MPEAGRKRMDSPDSGTECPIAGRAACPERSSLALQDVQTGRSTPAPAIGMAIALAGKARPLRETHRLPELNRAVLAPRVTLDGDEARLTTQGSPERSVK